MGFNSVIGFLFAFMVVLGFIFYSFVAFTEQIQDYSNLQQENKERLEHDSSSFTLTSAFYNSSRLKLKLENTGDYNLFFKEGQNNCFDIYVNGNFISHDNFNLYLTDPKANYYFIEPNNFAILDILTPLDTSSDFKVKAIACANVQKEALFLNSQFNWLNNSYKDRSFFNYTNPTANSQVKNTTYIILNNSNFDFSKGETDTIAFLLPVYQNLVLDATFDIYSQSLTDYSKYKNSLTLGTGAASSYDDPIQTTGVFFNALQFDGLNDTIRIVPDSSLELKNELTYSLWVKWLESGTQNHTLFRNGNNNNTLKIINDGSVNDNKIFFSLIIDNTLQELYSSSTLDSNWHLITSTFNGSQMNIYLDKTNVGSKDISYAQVNTSSFSNFIGSTNSSFEFFNGTIDDIKIFNIALTESEVSQLYESKLKFRDLDYIIQSWDTVNQNASINVTLPFVNSFETIGFEMYYYLYGDSYNASS